MKELDQSSQGFWDNPIRSELVQRLQTVPHDLRLKLTGRGLLKVEHAKELDCVGMAAASGETLHKLDAVSSWDGTAF